MKREGRDPVLKKSRWLLLKGSENLGDEQHFRLRDPLRYNLKSVRAYLLRTISSDEPKNNSASVQPRHTLVTCHPCAESGLDS